MHPLELTCGSFDRLADSLADSLYRKNLVFVQRRIIVFGWVRRCVR